MTPTTPKRGPGRPRKNLLPFDPEIGSPVDIKTEFPEPGEEWDTEMGVYIPTPTPPAWMDKLHLDSRVTTLKLVAMARQHGVTLQERWIGATLAHVGLSSETGKGFELLPALFGLIAHFQHKADKHNKTDPDKDREKKANADIAVMKAMDTARELVPLATAKAFWSDARIELRKAVELATYLSKEQKAELLKAFQRLKTKLQINGENEE